MVAGITVPVAVIMLACAGCYLFRRRSKPQDDPGHAPEEEEGVFKADADLVLIECERVRGEKESGSSEHTHTHTGHAPESGSSEHSGPDAGLAFRVRPDTFYHATSEENALCIQERGFVIPDGPGGLLGRGVYCTSTLKKAMDYLKGPHGGVILQLKIDLGNCKQLVENDPMMKT